MKGLYLLTTEVLSDNKTVKFGMSMRLESKWVEYLAVFNDAKYLYYYEILNDLTKEKIMDLEDKVLEKFKDRRNPYYQVGYFLCDDYDAFNKIVIDILEKNNVNFKVHNTHDFKIEYYDNEPEGFIRKN